MSWSWPGVAAMSRAIDGNATMTMKKSSTTMNAPAKITSSRALSNSVMRKATGADGMSAGPPAAAAPNLFVVCVTRTPRAHGIVPARRRHVYAQLLIWRKRVFARVSAVCGARRAASHGEPAHRFAIGVMFARELNELVERHRPAIGVALHHVAAHALEQLHVGGFFHAFGDHAQLQRVRQPHQALDDLVAHVAGGQLLDERAVDLERVHGKARQVRKRRVAGAEVVDTQAHAHAVQITQ